MSNAKPPPADAAQTDDALEMRQRADHLETLITAVKHQRTEVHDAIEHAQALAERVAQLDKRPRVDSWPVSAESLPPAGRGIPLHPSAQACAQAPAAGGVARR